MAEIRAYERGEDMVVLYYQASSGAEAQCPQCQWTGAVPQFDFIDECGATEFCCCRCAKKLGMIYALNQRAQCVLERPS